MSHNNQPEYQKYTGSALEHYREDLDLPAYIPSPALVQAVEIARMLQRPLLLRGEPGSGKTRLAEAIAVELHGEDYPRFYFPWPIKSTTKAREGLYEFDHLERMQDAYRSRESDQATTDTDPGRYVKLGPIGQAYERMNEFPNRQPPVILIDEIDKADIDFPNDLLWELERREFFIPEVKDADGNPRRIGIQGRHRGPVVIITSNDEKELPNAFLRRCLFHYIDFPGEEQLKTIVREYLKGLESRQIFTPDGHLPGLLKRFVTIRQQVKDNINAVKPPSTSELLDWAQILAVYLGKENWSVDDKMNLVYEVEKEDDQSTIIKEKEIRIRPEDVLLKNRDDRRLL